MFRLFPHTALLFSLHLLLVNAEEEDVKLSLIADQLRSCSLLVSTLVAAFPLEFGFNGKRDALGDYICTKKRPGYSSRKRVRKCVHETWRELGPSHGRRAHRMHEESFWKLHKPIYKNLRKKKSGKKKHKNGATNGLISSPARLSCALRHFAGGRPEDIVLVHGISHTEAFNSVWKIVDAANCCDELAFQCPTDHEKQRETAAGFKRRSDPNFSACGGCTDGMILWTEKPSDWDCALASCKAKKFFCARKNKFGLNLQGTCDSECRFLDVSMKHPASASDFLSFSTSGPFRNIETPGFLADGIVLFGDAAHANNKCMVTPFKNVSSGTEDDFNFFHSQLRIKIECAFGQLCAGWGILRQALPSAMGVKKATALAICLCRLHNCCTNERLERQQKNRQEAAPGKKNSESDPVPSILGADQLEIVANSGVPPAHTESNRCSPEGSLHGGHRHDDTTAAHRRQFQRRGVDRGDALPREKLPSIVGAGGHKRPTPKRWKQQN